MAKTEELYCKRCGRMTVHDGFVMRASVPRASVPAHVCTARCSVCKNRDRQGFVIADSNWR